MAVFRQAAVQTGGGVVGPGQGLSTRSTEALRCVLLGRAANEVRSLGRGLVCSLRRGLISGSLLLVIVACREGRPVSGIRLIFLARVRRTIHKSRAWQ